MIERLQWIITQASSEHDLSGLRDHFNPRARWKAAIAGARALHRFGTSQSRLSSTSKSSGGWKTISDSDDDDDDDKQTSQAAESPKDGPGENANVTVTSPEGAVLTASPESQSAPAPSKVAENHDAQPAATEAPSQRELKRADQHHDPLEKKVELDENHIKPNGQGHLEPSDGHHSDAESEELSMPGSFNFRSERRASNGHHHHPWQELFKKLRLK